MRGFFFVDFLAFGLLVFFVLAGRFCRGGVGERCLRAGVVFFRVAFLLAIDSPESSSVSVSLPSLLRSVGVLLLPVRVDGPSPV